MFLHTLGIAIALVAAPQAATDATPVEPTAAWLPSSIALVESPDADESGPVDAWKVLRDPTPSLLYRGLHDGRVAQLQRHLTRIGVYRGEIDGEYGRETEAAVVAVHKLAGVERSEVWQPGDWALELDHSAILARHPEEMDRLEIDIDRQVLFVVRAGEIAAILPVSSGNGELYWSKNGGPDGGLVRATTPMGDFKLFKHIDGWRKNYLGSLYKPWYFTPYYAVHGSSSVPAQPASHGCVRVPTWESDHLDSMLQLGLPVHIWDEPFRADDSGAPPDAVTESAPHPLAGIDRD